MIYTFSKREQMVEKFHERLYNLQKELGINNSQAAEYIGVSPGTYYSWLNGKAKGAETIFPLPNSAQLIKISNLYNVSIDYLLGRSDFTSPENDFVGTYTGLSDKAINALKQIKKQDKKEKAFGHNNIPVLDIVNFMFETFSMYEIAKIFRAFLKLDYRIPTYYDDEKHAYVAIPNVPTVDDTPNDTYVINLAADKNNLADNIYFQFDDGFLETVQLQKLEYKFRDMVKLWKRHNKKG